MNKAAEENLNFAGQHVRPHHNKHYAKVMPFSEILCEEPYAYFKLIAFIINRKSADNHVLYKA